MLIKLLKAIVNDRIKKHNFKKVVNKTHKDQGFVIDGEVDKFYVDNDDYIITPIKSIADCSKFEILKSEYYNTTVYLEEMERLESSFLKEREEIEKTCLTFEIEVDRLEAVEY